MPSDSPTTEPEAATLVRLSDQLTTAFRTVLRSSPLDGLGPIEMARVVGVDKTFASRLMTALRATDPLAALHALPGTSPLRRFLRAAGVHGASVQAVDAAERELVAFERELQRTFGTRTRLDAALADALPQSRRKHEESARQAVFRGLSLIKGLSIDLASITWVVHPSRGNPDVVDIQVLAAFVGVRRLRPSARVRFSAKHASAGPRAGAVLVEGFCRPADLSISMTRDHDLMFYEIASGSIRRDAAADVFLSELLAAAAPRTGPAEPGRVLLFGDAVSYPYKRLALSILIHEDAWPGCDFSLRAYDTVIRGMVKLPDPAREPDRLPLDVPIIRERVSAELLRSSSVPRYPELLGHLTTPLGWDVAGGGFRMFGCEIVYPLYGAQIILVRE